MTGKYMRINQKILSCERNLMIRYPFEMSQVFAQKAIEMGEQAVFAIKYRIISS